MADSNMLLVLGAGFSRAVHHGMPLVDELGNAAISLTRLGPGRAPTEFNGGSFEIWLSRQAQPQPYRSPVADADAAAVFLAFSEAIGEVINARVLDSLQLPAPSWLVALVRVLHAKRATVITFNYDPLLECAITAARLYDWAAPQADYRHAPGRAVDFRHVLAGGSPRMLGGWYGLEDVEELSTFRLLKLHGSSNWFVVPSDSTGATLRALRIPGHYGAPEPITDSERRRQVPGHQPFIVPPTAAKGSFYGDPLLREIWSQAAAALRSGDQVSLLGYSLPLTDLVTRGLIQDNLPPSVSVSVADLEPDPPNSDGLLDRLHQLGYTEGEVYDGADCIPLFVKALVDQQLPLVKQAIATASRKGAASANKPIAVGCHPGHLAIVKDIEKRGDGAVVLHTHVQWGGYPLAGATPTGQLPTLGSLHDWATRSSATILAKLPEGGDLA